MFLLKIMYVFLGKAIGDACITDFDGDGVLDTVDTCPSISNIQKTSFENYFLVDLNPTLSAEPQPKWRITNKVCRVPPFLSSSKFQRPYRIFILLISINLLNQCYVDSIMVNFNWKFFRDRMLNRSRKPVDLSC